MPTIDFRTFDGSAFENFRPVLAKNYHPEWWKKAKVKVHHRGQTVQTLRSCPAMDDYLKLGWYIIATQDIPVMNGHDWNFPEENEIFVTSPNSPIRSPSHGSSQFEDIFEYMGEDCPVKDAFKISQRWNITTPEGYSTFFIDPFLFQNQYFAVWQGIIDTDNFNMNMDNAQIIFYPKVNHSFIIPAGQPICQFVPYKREEYHATYTYAESNEWYQTHGIHDRSMQKWQMEGGHMKIDPATGEYIQRKASEKLNIGGYRNAKIKTNKAKLFSEDTPPPECPMHKKEEQMEFDFKVEQKKRTELNWDGDDEKGN